MWKRFKIPSLALVILLIGALLVACAPEETPPPTTPEQPAVEKPGTITLGLALPYSGAIAHLANAIGSLCELTWEQINNDGGLTLGGKKYLLEWYKQDTKYTAADTVSAVQKLLDENKIQFLIGPIPSAGTIAVMPTLDRARVPYFYISGTTQAMEAVSKGEVTVPFAGTMHLAVFLPAFLTWLQENYTEETKNIAFLEPDDETGHGTYALAKPAYGLLGINEVVEPTFTPRGTADYVPYLTKIVRAKPGSIHMLNAGGMPIALVVKQARELGFKGLIVTGPPYVTDEFVETAGGWQNAENVLSTSMPARDDPNIPPDLLKRIAAFEAKHGTFSASMGRYVCVPDIIPGALKLADSPDPEKVIKALESGAELETVNPPLKTISVHKYSHMVAGPNFITIVKDGKIKFLTMFTPDQALDAATKFYDALTKPK